MDSTDVLVVGGIALALYFLWPRKAAPLPLLTPSVTTEEFYQIPYYLDIHSGLFDAPGAGLVNQNVSRGIPL